METQKQVFCTQIPHRMDADTGKLTPALSVASAQEFGTVTVLMGPRGSFFDTKELARQISYDLREFNNDQDCLLPLGDPILTASCCAFLGRRFDYFDVLRWDKGLGRYTKQRVVVR